MNSTESPSHQEPPHSPNTFVMQVQRWIEQIQARLSQQAKVIIVASSTLFTILVIFVLIVSHVTTPVTQAIRSTAGNIFHGGNPSSQATVLWQDEFNGTSLDTTKWSLLKGGHFYTPASQETYTSDNVSVHDGSLNIASKAQQRDGYAFTSGGVSSQGKFSFLYGRVDWRVKFPSGNGLWPALWLIPQDGQSMYEIDVAEFFGNTPDSLLMNSHWTAGNKDNENATMTTVSNLSADFHTISLIWEPNEIDWLMDGTLRKISTSHIPNTPMFFYMNTAIGSYAGYPDSTTSFPQTFAIDYVRVSKLPTQSGNVLTGKVDVTNTTQDLTSTGTTDWVSWGINSANDNDHKDTTSMLPLNFDHVGNGDYEYSGGGGMPLIWHDGKITKNGSNQQKGVTVCGLNNGFGFAIPATQQTQVLRLYVNAWRGRGQLIATLTDKSISPYTDTTLANENGNQSGVYTITFKAASSGQSLLVHWTAADAYINKCVVIQAVTLGSK